MKKLLLSILALAALCLNSGCAALIVAQLRGKLPSAEAEEVKLSVNIVGAGGGYIEATGISTKYGKLVAASYVEEVTTGGGHYKLEAKGVDVAKVKAKK